MEKFWECGARVSMLVPKTSDSGSSPATPTMKEKYIKLTSLITPDSQADMVATRIDGRLPWQKYD